VDHQIFVVVDAKPGITPNGGGQFDRIVDVSFVVPDRDLLDTFGTGSAAFSRSVVRAGGSMGCTTAVPLVP
jgi:hypothetical protein